MRTSVYRFWGLLAMINLAGFSLASGPDLNHGSHVATGSRPPRIARHSPAEVLLVYNANSPISTAIAKDYSARRNVSKMVTVHCADSAANTSSETISHADYSLNIAAPIKAYLKNHPEINFIVLTKGVPIRIEGARTGWSSRPSVDSYLAAIDYPAIKGAVKISITDAGIGGFGWLNRYWKAAVPFDHARFGGYLVTRLDGYTQADALALVSRAQAAEKPAVRGVTVLLDVQPEFGVDDVPSQPQAVSGAVTADSRRGSFNADMVKTGRALVALKIPVDLDMDPRFVGQRANLLGYFSWGSNDSHYSPQAYESLTFAPGSVGDTAVSTSARTFLPTVGGQSLIADLIAHGITGVKGYVDEPLLLAIASPSIALDRYTSGFTLAESLYAASRFVGWEDIVIGDPLVHWPWQPLQD